MDKQTIIPIVLVVIVTITIGLLIYFKDRTKEPELLDTSLFNVIKVEDTKNLLEKSKNKAQFIYIGRKDCSACKKFEPYINYSMGLTTYTVNYIELSEINTKSDEYNNLIEILNEYEYTWEDETKPFGEFIGSTPMLFILKNQKVVWANLGGMKSEELANIIEKYGVNNE